MQSPSRLITCVFNSPPNYELILNRNRQPLEFATTGFCNDVIRLVEHKFIRFLPRSTTLIRASLVLYPRYVGPPFPEQDFDISYGIGSITGSLSHPTFTPYPGFWDDHRVITESFMPFSISISNEFVEIPPNGMFAIIASVSTNTAADKVKLIKHRLSIDTGRRT